MEPTHNVSRSKAYESALKKIRPLVLSSLVLPTIGIVPAVAAQEAADREDEVEVIEVRGIRKTIQDSISIKREATTIVDGLSADDIGELPALSIGEAIETITGAASHREQGGATEISIRGLGPFLGSTVINGREATNGSGDRSVNFSQFPSELFNAIKVYKTQEASLIEGGVSGQIALETLKPLDYDKTRFQVEAKGNWNPDNNQLENPEREFGSRVTASYIDQFEFDNGSRFGISIGAQQNIATNPEQEARSTSTFRDCRFDPNSSAGIFASGNCDSGDGDLALEVDPATGVAPDADTPFILASSARSYRQNITDDDRDSVFAAIQWQPNDKLDINIDYQASDRTFTEVRNDLVFAENRRIDAPDVDRDGRLPVDLSFGENGSLFAFTALQRIETNSTYAERIEEYDGGGINIAYQVNDVLKISADYSISETNRREIIIQTRLQSEPTDIFGNDVPGAADNGRVETATEIGQNGNIIPIFTVRNFDVTNADNFADAARTRVDLNQFRNNEIEAFRSDFEYLADLGAITRLKGGFRVSKLEFDSAPRSRDQFTFSDDDIAAVSQACRNNVFPESGFLSEGRTGNLITNVDDNGNVIEQGTGNTFATFDALCLAREFLGEDPVVPGPQITNQNVDVEEETTAVYLQADYNTEIAGYTVRGNFGLRYIDTEVTSTGFRGPLQTVLNDEGGISDIVEVDGAELITVTGGGDYQEFLPSISAVIDVRDDVLVRAGVFRALSRPDPSNLGFGRNFNGLSDESAGGGSIDNVAEAVGEANANGNPFLDPLTSWNYDFAIEWYPNADTILAAGIYYKVFEGNFENVIQNEEFTVDGVAFNTLVSTQETDDDTSEILGFELTASHAFSYLPGFWSGFGTKLSYNYADSNFEFEDGQFGSGSVVNGSDVVERVGIVDPANVFGFSRHVASAQLYYQVAGWNVQLVYKYRSEYFQQFISTPGNLRFIGDTGVYEARVSYRLNDNWKFTAEAINLFDEPRRQFNPNRDNLSEVNIYGQRVFAGVQYKF